MHLRSPKPMLLPSLYTVSKCLFEHLRSFLQLTQAQKAKTWQIPRCKVFLVRELHQGRPFKVVSTVPQNSKNSKNSKVGSHDIMTIEYHRPSWRSLGTSFEKIWKVYGHCTAFLQMARPRQLTTSLRHKYRLCRPLFHGLPNSNFTALGIEEPAATAFSHATA